MSFFHYLSKIYLDKNLNYKNQTSNTDIDYLLMKRTPVHIKCQLILYY